MMTKKIKTAIIILIILALVAIGYLVYNKYFSAQYQQVPENNYLNTSVETSTSSQINLTANSVVKPQNALISGFNIYKNSDFGFEIQYPATWTVSEENIENVRGEQTKGFFFKKPGSDLRFAILPRNGLSYGLSGSGASTPVYIGGSLGVQTKYTQKDGRRLWLVHPQYSLYNWSQDIGRIDILSSADDSISDTQIFEKMLNSFKFAK